MGILTSVDSNITNKTSSSVIFVQKTEIKQGQNYSLGRNQRIFDFSIRNEDLIENVAIFSSASSIYWNNTIIISFPSDRKINSASQVGFC